MLGSAVKVAVLLASTTVAVPYTVAVLCNLMYGWPQTKNKYRRALNPKKVFKLNYAVLQKFLLLRYAPLYFRWKQYYRKTHGPELIKNLVFGRNDNTMDLYQPKSSRKEEKSVVIFIYGGAWGSGDKHMYSLLCNQLANKLESVVCCPNYSTYPRGYVDDMIQDVVDCISWVYENIHDYGGDKDKILLIGHSSGAHLGAMAILELLHDERVSAYPYTNQAITFDDTHYNGGLAGVYHIKDHFLHESSRGIEDISSMGQAMYGEGHFDRFSPTVILANLQHSISLPKLVLVHGSDDFVVPLTSTSKFGEVLSEVYADVTVCVVPDCDHYSVCLDLMLPTRRYYDQVMGIIMETHNKLFPQT
ncbi:hypothetical protein LOTGIDRAFT_130315 [Lottia gigantea]|uniref:BD-FAE-like domain-containing protein n=1 Tax=Lottia gigantea TaxID=225164 RepID=V3ZN96_LOTGI|nr:hypothetical protein LOTGIDRAFT_130315 [Lottia gigantea]ESO85802.1 hypothetical protein LOTGIDRAFT_130315 [Lottia gigantea]